MRRLLLLMLILTGTVGLFARNKIVLVKDTPSGESDSFERCYERGYDYVVVTLDSLTLTITYDSGKYASILYCIIDVLTGNELLSGTSEEGIVTLALPETAIGRSCRIDVSLHYIGWCGYAIFVPCAEYVRDNGIRYQIVSSGEGDGTAMVVASDEESGYSGDVVIPSEIVSGNRKFPVTDIYYDAFYACDSLISVVVPGSVREIRGCTFSHCANLKSVVLHDGVERLSNMLIPESQAYFNPGVKYDSEDRLRDVVARGFQTYSDGCFSDCPSLEYVSLPESLRQIGDKAFAGCVALVGVTLPDSLRQIGNEAFAKCEALVDIALPSGIEKVGELAFYGCKSLRSISIPDGISIIRERLFFGCSSLRQVSIPESVNTIESLAFSFCSSLTDICIPPSVTTIYTNNFFLETPFEDCLNLRNVSISLSNTDIIGDYPLFYGLGPDCRVTLLDDSITSDVMRKLEGITHIVLSERVRYVDEATLCQRKDLTDIDVADGNCHFASDNGVLFSKNMEKLLVYPRVRTGGYTIPESVTDIGDLVFYGNKLLTDIAVPEGVDSLCDRAFYGCSSLETMVLGGDTRIGNEAFGCCYKLRDVVCHSPVPPVVKAFNTSQTRVFNACDILLRSNVDNFRFERINIYGREVIRLSSRYGVLFPELIGEDGLLDGLWEAGFILPEMPAGRYRVYMEVLPSGIYEQKSTVKPNKFYVELRWTNSSGLSENYYMSREKGRYLSFENDANAPDTLLVADVVITESGSDDVANGSVVTVMARANHSYRKDYTNVMCIGSIIVEPVGDSGQEQSEQEYSGAFTSEVYNEARLYVPETSIDSYGEAPVWRLFNNIQTNITGVRDNVDKNGIDVSLSDGTLLLSGLTPGQRVRIYDSTGRVVDSAIADGNTLSLQVQSQGICLVLVDGHAYKVALD